MQNYGQMNMFTERQNMNVITESQKIVKPKIELFNMDCMEYIKTCKDNEFELAIVDPPYGISVDNNKKGNFVMTKHKSKSWDDEIPKEQYFEELFRISKKQIIWGGNYFPLDLKKGWICWDKVNPLTGKFSDFELAWTSFLNCDRMYKQEWIGFGRKFIEKEDSIHPTQKPKRLYEWILKNFGEQGDRILDTHLGSGSSAIAAYNYNFDFVGLEIDKEYFDSAVKRFNNHKSQLTMF
jgi:site-specific DNA-methyltransferase (adenine-specific)